MEREAEKLFHQLADLPPDERERHLARPEIPAAVREEVQSLLRHDAGTSPVLLSGVAGGAEHVLRDGGIADSEARCGPYRLLRPLGRGGMGAVYLAERADGEVEQLVAIKLLRYGADEPAFRDRFLRERQILASLSHPGIGRLLDAGHTLNGQPYLVMEYIDGVPIDEYAAQLDIPGRLELFLPVCDAVTFAHRNLIVHRDLKPSNILVDSAGHPKLLDFGIAKILDVAMDQTQTGERMLTPEYASPEQVRGAAQTTATDVYSLGAVLYRLLTGRSPHAFASPTRNDVELAICTREAIAPSRLNPGLPRDLDFILSKALRKEPDERYVSVDALAEDVRAFLESRPVRARSGSTLYRARKFLRRYWLPLAAAAITLAGLSVGLFVANRERAIAQRRFQQVRQLSNRVLALDANIRALPGATKARLEIVSMSKEYLEALAPEAAIDKDLALEIGAAYLLLARVQGVPSGSNLGQFKQAEQSLAQADAFVESALGAAPQRRIALLHSAEIANDRMILAETDHRDAEALRHAQRAAARLDALLSSGRAEPAELAAASGIYHNIALAHKNMNLFEQSGRYARRLIEIARPVESLRTYLAAGYSVLADDLRFQGDLDGALQAAQEAQQVVAKIRYPDDTMRLYPEFSVLFRTGVILGREGDINLGRTEEAIASLEKAYAIAEAAARKDANDYSSRSREGEAGRELAGILLRRDPARALKIYDHALLRLGEIKDNVKARRDEVLLQAGAARALRRLHHDSEAGQRIEIVLRLGRQTKDYPAETVTPRSVAETILQAVAEHQAETGQPERAAGTYQDLLDRLMTSKPNLETDLRHAIDISQIYEDLAVLYRRIGRPAQAGALAALRLKLWTHWDRRLPNNRFVRKQLAAAGGK